MVCTNTQWSVPPINGPVATFNGMFHHSMGFRSLGFGATRGRLYTKHPELYKYCGDQDDKQWLHDNTLMPSTGGKAYLMISSDIRELAETDEYR